MEGRGGKALSVRAGIIELLATTIELSLPVRSGTFFLLS